MNKKELFDALDGFSQELLVTLAEVDPLNSIAMVVKIYKEFTMMDFMFVQTPMVNVVKMMKSVFSVMNCYLGSKHADSTKF